MKKFIAIIALALLLTAIPVFAEEVEAEAEDVSDETMQYGENEAAYETEPVEVEAVEVTETEQTTETTYEETYVEATEGISQEDSQMISKEVSREIRVMNENLGAKIRILQLERSARVNYAKANAVMDYITTTYPDQDITALEEIMTEITALAEEAKAHNPAEYEMKENIELFVSWKKQGQELTQAFREESNKILTEEDKEKIRQRFAEIERKAAEKIDEILAEAKKEHNAAVLQNAMERLGVEKLELIQQVRSGQLTPEEIKTRIRTEYKTLNEEQKMEIKQKLTERAFEERKQRLEIIKEAKMKELEIEKELRKKQAENIKERIKFIEEQKRQKIRQDVVGDARSRAMAASFNGNGMPGNGRYAYNGNGGPR